MPENKEIIDSDLCNNCKHYWGIDKCFAFPDGIPNVILHGENQHTKPLDGQINDLGFEEFIYKNNKKN